MAITIEKLDEDWNPKSPAEVLTLSPVARVELRTTFQPVLADTSEQRDSDKFDPRFIHDYLKGRRLFDIHERVHEGGGKTAFENAIDRIEFFVEKEYRDRFEFKWGAEEWYVAVNSARIVKVPAENIYDCYIQLVGIR